MSVKEKSSNVTHSASFSFPIQWARLKQCVASSKSLRRLVRSESADAADTNNNNNGHLRRSAVFSIPNSTTMDIEESKGHDNSTKEAKSDKHLTTSTKLHINSMCLHSELTQTPERQVAHLVDDMGRHKINGDTENEEGDDEGRRSLRRVRSSSWGTRVRRRRLRTASAPCMSEWPLRMSMSKSESVTSTSTRPPRPTRLSTDTFGGCSTEVTLTPSPRAESSDEERDDTVTLVGDETASTKTTQLMATTDGLAFTPTYELEVAPNTCAATLAPEIKVAEMMEVELPKWHCSLPVGHNENDMAEIVNVGRPKPSIEVVVQDFDTKKFSNDNHVRESKLGRKWTSAPHLVTLTSDNEILDNVNTLEAEKHVDLYNEGDRNRRKTTWLIGGDDVANDMSDRWSQTMSLPTQRRRQRRMRAQHMSLMEASSPPFQSEEVHDALQEEEVHHPRQVASESNGSRTASIQEAIRRQSAEEELNTFFVDNREEQKRGRLNSETAGSKLTNVTTKPKFSADTLPRASVVSSINVSTEYNGGVRLARGRHPLRGPFGQMLDAQMRQSTGGLRKARHASDADVITFLASLGNKESAMNADNSRKKAMAGPLGHHEGGGHIDVSHIRTKSSPSDLLPAFSFDTKEKSSGNENHFAAAISHDQLHVHQDLLVSRATTNMSNDEQQQVKLKEDSKEEKEADDDNGMSTVAEKRAASFRRTKDTRSLIVKELLHLENYYVDSLHVLLEKYYGPLKQSGWSASSSSAATNSLVDDIFFQIPQILAHHQCFLRDLKTRVDSWETRHTIGDWFLTSFRNESLMEAYSLFIRNVRRADEAIRICRQCRPGFDKFLQDTRTDRRLGLTDLLAKPHQRIPRYRLLIQRLLDHTSSEHTDYPLLKRAEKEIHEFASKINAVQNESNEQEQRQKVLRNIELSVQGLHANDLGSSPNRLLLRHDLVAMTQGVWSRKERYVFLFNDLLLITSIGKRAARDIRRSSSLSLTSVLAHSRLKLWMWLSLEDVELSPGKEDQLRQMLRQTQQMEQDLNTLEIIGAAASRLHCPHADLDNVQRQLMAHLRRQLREAGEQEQQSNYLELRLLSLDETAGLIFESKEKRVSWEEVFVHTKRENKANNKEEKVRKNKREMGRLNVSNSTKLNLGVELLTLVSIRKTRSGLRFTCAAPTLGRSGNNKSKDVWVCNSDGYVGQVCVLSMMPEPTVVCCNGVCNAKILSIVAVPNLSNDTNQLRPLHRQDSSTGGGPELGLDGVGRRPGPESESVVQETCGRRADPMLDSSSSEFELNRDMAESSASSSSDDDLDEELEEDGSGERRRPRRRSSVLTENREESNIKDSSESFSTGSHCSDSVKNAVTNPHEDHGNKNNDAMNTTNTPTMWLGTEDGYIHIFDLTDNIRIKKNKEKFIHNAPVLLLLYLENRVYASLANGDLVVHERNDEGVWDKSSVRCLPIGTNEHPVRSMVAVGSQVWCAVANVVKILEPDIMEIEASFDAWSGPDVDEDVHEVLCMVHSGLGLWVAYDRSTTIRVFHTLSKKCLVSLDITSAASQVLAGVDEIICKHKSMCLRVTALMACKQVLWVGTSAGIVITMAMPHIATDDTADKLGQSAMVGNNHGHSGHVRFLTCLNNEKKNSESIVISGGDGYENFGLNNDNNNNNNNNGETVGREDSTNHLLLWRL